MVSLGFGGLRKRTIGNVRDTLLKAGAVLA